MTVLKMTDCESLSSVDCSNNHIATLDFSGSDNLTTVMLEHNLTRLDLSNFQMLQSVNCSQNQINVIDVSFCPNLMTLNFRGNPLVTLYTMGDYSLRMISGIWSY